MSGKKPAAVVAAEAARAAKAAELKGAEEAVKRLLRELGDATAAVRAAQVAADASLPQCTMAIVGHYSGVTKREERVVILRRTPGGMLVVREVGSTIPGDYRFQYGKYSNCWRQIGKSHLFNEYRELRDVPPEFMPQEQKP